ncbi:hypothetical protein HDU67_007298 [Dinochytrium kinnereticum]|nr:hypothetical protein HDU67_007298 [Dinochytrium kinnereticum]
MPASNGEAAGDDHGPAERNLRKRRRGEGGNQTSIRSSSPRSSSIGPERASKRVNANDHNVSNDGCKLTGNVIRGLRFTSAEPTESTSESTTQADLVASGSPQPLRIAQPTININTNAHSSHSNPFQERLIDMGDSPDDEPPIFRESAMKSYLESVQARVVQECRDLGKPRCYLSGTFWIRPQFESPFLALQHLQACQCRQDSGEEVDNGVKSSAKANASTPNKPTRDCLLFSKDELPYLPDVFIWHPLILMEGILSCMKHPSCTGRYTSNGWTKEPLARRIIDVDRSFYLMSPRYRCTKCMETVCAHDDNILSQLPPKLRYEFPAALQRRSGVSSRVAGLIESYSHTRTGKQKGVAVVKGLHARREEMVRLQCEDFVEHRRAVVEDVVDAAGVAHEVLENLVELVEFVQGAEMDGALGVTDHRLSAPSTGEEYPLLDGMRSIMSSSTAESMSEVPREQIASQEPISHSTLTYTSVPSDRRAETADILNRIEQIEHLLQPNISQPKPSAFSEFPRIAEEIAQILQANFLTPLPAHLSPRPTSPSTI